MVGGQSWHIVHETPIFCSFRAEWTRGVAQAVECLLCKCKAPSSNPDLQKKVNLGNCTVLSFDVRTSNEMERNNRHVCYVKMSWCHQSPATYFIPWPSHSSTLPLASPWPASLPFPTLSGLPLRGQEMANHVLQTPFFSSFFFSYETGSFQTCDPPNSLSWVLGLQSYTTTLGFQTPLKAGSLFFFSFLVLGMEPRPLHYHLLYHWATT
jgi:hypothetical protein